MELGQEPRPLVIGLCGEAGSIAAVVLKYTVKRRGFLGDLVDAGEQYQKRISVEDVRTFPADGDCRELFAWLDREALDSRTLLGKAREIHLVVDRGGIDGGTLLRAMDGVWWARCKWRDRRRGHLVRVVRSDVLPHKTDTDLEVGRLGLAATLRARGKEGGIYLERGRWPLLAAQIVTFRQAAESDPEEQEALAKALALGVFLYEHLERGREDRICPTVGGG